MRSRILFIQLGAGVDKIVKMSISVSLPGIQLGRVVRVDPNGVENTWLPRHGRDEMRGERDLNVPKVGLAEIGHAALVLLMDFPGITFAEVGKTS